MMARDIMCILITIVALDSAFSIGNKLIFEYRNSLQPDNVKSLICTQSWLCGYEIKGNMLTYYFKCVTIFIC